MYEAYLKEKGLVKNSTSYYMRIWRSVYNLSLIHIYNPDTILRAGPITPKR